jgi:hypothetical protein
MAKKYYTFSIEITGHGETEKEALEDAAERLSYELSEGLADYSVLYIEEE